MATEYCLVDIPSTLTPKSFLSLKPTSPKAPTEPRNPPEQKKEGAKWPQAEDLQKIHELYGKNLESVLQEMHRSTVTQWCAERIERDEDIVEDEADFRKWNETFQIMKVFKNEGEGGHIQQLSEGDGSLCPLIPSLMAREQSMSSRRRLCLYHFQSSSPNEESCHPRGARTIILYPCSFFLYPRHLSRCVGYIDSLHVEKLTLRHHHP
jgi:hypothetical protein